MALLLIGLSYRTTTIELRECLHLSKVQLDPALTKLKMTTEQVQEVAIVSTCNRFEIYAAVHDANAGEHEIIAFLCDYYQLRRHALQSALYIMQGQAVVDHLMCVASGLDSMVLGESQILGQIGDALECAVQADTIGANLHRLFESSLHTGKRAHTETAISQHTTSISHAAALLVNQKLTGVTPYVVVVGAGDVAKLAAEAVRDSGLTQIAVLNRTTEHGKALARMVDGCAYPWVELWEQLKKADVVISATGAPHLVLRLQDVHWILQQRQEKPLIIVDVALPRDVDPAVRDIPLVTLYDIDDMQLVVDDNLAQREACIPDVNAIITEESAKYWTWLNQRSAVPLIKELRQKVQDVFETELHEALYKLAHLDEAEQAVVRRMAHRIMNKVLHNPTMSLREQAANGSVDMYVALVRQLFSLTDDEDEDTAAKT